MYRMIFREFQFASDRDTFLKGMEKSFPVLCTWWQLLCRYVMYVWLWYMWQLSEEIFSHDLMHVTMPQPTVNQSAKDKKTKWENWSGNKLYKPIFVCVHFSLNGWGQHSYRVHFWIVNNLDPIIAHKPNICQWYEIKYDMYTIRDVSVMFLASFQLQYRLFMWPFSVHCILQRSPYKWSKVYNEIFFRQCVALVFFRVVQTLQRRKNTSFTIYSESGDIFSSCLLRIIRIKSI